MNFLRQSLFRKFLLDLVILSGVLGIIFYLFFDRFGQIVAPLYFILGALILTLTLFLLIFWWDVIRPLKIVLSQMQSLISGNLYKQIFTDRIDEIGILAYFFNQVTKGLGEVSRDIVEKDRMLSELTIASKLQKDILPLESPNINGLQIVAKNKPATELGGDSFNFFISKDKVYIYLGDVTGHGVAAGLIMTMANSLVTVFSDLYNNAFDVIVNVNKYIKKHVKRAMFMTMIMLSWDEKNKKMTYVGAGHEHIIVYNSASGDCKAIVSGGVALGMVPDNSKIVSEKEIPFEEGDYIVLYSDGITESRNKDGVLFGLDRLVELVKEFAPQYTAEGLNYHIAKAVTDFSSRQDDDMTLIVIKRDSSPVVSDNSINWKE